jgi:hypothetical protein
VDTVSVVIIVNTDGPVCSGAFLLFWKNEQLPYHHGLDPLSLLLTYVHILMIAEHETHQPLFRRRMYCTGDKFTYPCDVDTKIG